MTLSELIIKHEGLKLKPYICPAGRLSIGVGRNLDDNGITEAEAMFLLSTDIKRTEAELENFSFTRFLNEPRRIAIADMLFNIGLPTFVKFKRMIACLEDSDYTGAAREMLDSHWADQVGKRARDLALIVRTGEFPTIL